MISKLRSITRLIQIFQQIFSGNVFILTIDFYHLYAPFTFLYTQKGTEQHTYGVVRRLKYPVKSGAPSSHSTHSSGLHICKILYKIQSDFASVILEAFTLYIFYPIHCLFNNFLYDKSIANAPSGAVSTIARTAIVNTVSPQANPNASGIPPIAA